MYKLQMSKLTIMTARIARTKATAPGKMEFGTYGMKVDHMTCIMHGAERQNKYKNLMTKFSIWLSRK